MFKRLLTSFILFIGLSLFVSTIKAQEIEITWEDYFTEITPGVYEEKETRYITNVTKEFELKAGFFSNITKIEIGVKDIYPPFEGDACLYCENSLDCVVNNSDFSDAQYFEFEGITLITQRFVVKYQEAGHLSGNVVNYTFTVNNQGARDLAMQMSMSADGAFIDPITIFRFRISGTPKQRLNQTVDLVPEVTLLNAGALWHEERYVSGFERAYVYMQIYNGQKWIKTGLDNKIALTYDSRFDINEFVSSRSIKAPHGYNKLVINVGSNKYVYSNMTHIILVADGISVYIKDGDYGVKLKSVDAETQIYWEKTIDTSNDIVIAGWNELPLGTQSYNDISSFEAIEDATPVSLLVKEGGYYDIRIKIGDEYYLSQNTLIPSKVKGYQDVYAFYFSTREARFIWFFFNNVDTVAKSLVNDSWLIWNLDTGEWNQVIHSTIHGLPWYDKDVVFAPNVYSDISIPYPIDDVISITVDFEYRYHYVFDIRYMSGYYGKWQAKQIVLKKGATSTEEVGWWNWVLVGYYAALKTIYNYATGNNIIDNIENIDHIVNDDYKVNFINSLEERGSGNYTQAKVFPPGSSVYRLHLGTFNKTGSDGVEVKDVLYSNFTYEYNGVEYSEPFPQQATPNPLPEYSNDENRRPGFWFKVWMWIMKNPDLAITIVVVTVVVFVFGPFIIGMLGKWRRSLRKLNSGRYRR